MIIRLAGPDLAEPLLKGLADTTNHAVVRPADATFDQGSQTLTLLVRLAPAAARRMLPGFRHLPPSTQLHKLVVRNVTACRIHAEPGDEDQEYQLLFGVQLRPSSVYLCSAAEDRGTPCLEIDATVTSLDVTLSPVEDRSSSRLGAV